jgi:hypothetical protein
LRLFQGQEEIFPPHRPEKVADKGKEHGRKEITIIHLIEGVQQLMEIDFTEQQIKKEKTYPDPDPEFFVGSPL